MQGGPIKDYGEQVKIIIHHFVKIQIYHDEILFVDKKFVNQ